VIHLADPGALETGRFAFAVMALGAVALITTSLVVARRLAGTLAPWAWGGVTFVLSQLVRAPFLALVTGAVTGGAQPDAMSPAWIVLVTAASLSAGIFEEGSRALILATAGRRIRGTGPGVAYGLGHGATEALLLVLTPAIAAIVLVGGILDGSLTVSLPAETAAALDQAATLFATQTVGISLIAILERVLAMALHVILALLVLRIVERGGGRSAIMRRLALPIAIHASVNLVAVIAAQAFGVLVAEGLVAIAVANAARIYWFLPKSPAGREID
jgi:uncharacterized membrane protein YhfC